ncbi:manganese efflux pump MntP family protein [Legionella israelensis]|uniref:manganese efflux pump MntP n=1 Tax=Legionella israelensis TaxID=454 RepID=UPI001FD4FB1E|nr:manganese efflux pump [Legionella israelensis]
MQLYINIFEPIILGLVLSADSFSAAVAMGFRPHKFSDSLKFAASSGGAETILTLLGAMAGGKIVSQFSPIDHWIAFILLFSVSAHMVYEGFLELRNKSSHIETIAFHGFAKVLIVSLATSIDALAVGVSLGVSNKPLLAYLLSIGGFAFASVIAGMALARKVPKHLSAVFNLVGAFIIFILACDMLGFIIK